MTVFCGVSSTCSMSAYLQYICLPAVCLYVYCNIPLYIRYACLPAVYMSVYPLFVCIPAACLLTLYSISAYHRFLCLSAIAVIQTCLDGQQYCKQADISAYLQYAIHMSVRGEFVYLLYVSLTEVSLSICVVFPSTVVSLITHFYLWYV
jgi:hypothetical protein